MQFVLVSLQPFRHNSLLKCALQPKIVKKITKTPIMGVQVWSFKVIDVDTAGKLDSSACYDKQHVCAYVQPFSR